MRARAVLSTLSLVMLAALGVPGAAVAGNTTPPDGHLVIEGGAAWTNDPVLHLDVTATDDLGVVTVRVRRENHAWQEYPYSPQITFSLGAPASLQDIQYWIEVEWIDGAGNKDNDGGVIGYDGTAPKLLGFQETTPTGPARTVTFQLDVDESFNGTGKVRFSSNGGDTWGNAIDLPGSSQVVWNPRKAAQGGNNRIGPRTVSAQVRDQAGNWSNVRKADILVSAPDLRIKVSANPTTGEPITLTPDWEGGVAFPPGTICRWTFAWGNDASLYQADHDETFGLVQIAGPPSKGYCDVWRFTLPWTPVRQYLITYTVIADDVLAEAALGDGPGSPNLKVAVGSTSRDITASNLPMLYVLPEQWQLTVGVPVTYTAHGVGGGTVLPTDDWQVQLPNGNEHYPGSDSLTFTPTMPGHVTVCLYRRGPHGPTLGACYDPRVKRASSGPTASGVPSDAPAASQAPAPSGAATAEATAPIESTSPTLSAIAIGGTTAPSAAPDPAAMDADAGPRPVVIGLAVVALLVAGAGLVAFSRGWHLRLRGTRPD